MTGVVEHLPNGVAVHQTTDEEADKSNIYCEFPWCPPDSHCFVYVRHAPEHTPNTAEYVACDFGTWEKRLVGRGCGGATMANCGRFYFRRATDSGSPELVRCDLCTGTKTVIEIPESAPRNAGFRISKDERYLAYSQRLSVNPQMYGVGIVDRRDGTSGIIHEDRWICNTHLQFEPGAGRQLLVQHNRGCVLGPEGKMEVLCGKEGCTLFLLDVPDGKVTRLQVGPPYTVSLSGHETWRGATGEVIATLNYAEDYDYGKGRIIGVRAGGPHREICTPWELNHIGMEPSGRIFAGDAYRPDEVVIGSPRTDRAVAVCASQASYSRRPGRTGREPLVYDSHPHAYISPDLKWVVFNSDRTGVQQIYAAEIPPETIAALESG